MPVFDVTFQVRVAKESIIRSCTVESVTQRAEHLHASIKYHFEDFGTDHQIDILYVYEHKLETPFEYGFDAGKRQLGISESFGFEGHELEEWMRGYDKGRQS